MSETRSPGQPTKFTPEITQKIIEGIKGCLILRQACGYAEISYQTLYNWLNIGRDDINKGLLTEYASFFYAVKKTQAEEVKELITEVKAKVKNWQAIAWLLERCFREDFGQDAGIIQDLLDKCEKLEQAFKRFNDSAPLQGVVNNG